MFEKLKERRGEFLINHAFGLILGAAVLCLVISALSVAFQSNKLTTIANNLTRSIEIRGQVDHASINSELSSLTATAGLENVAFSIDANYFDNEGRIQYGSSFIVTLTYTAELDLGGLVEIPIPLRSRVVGRSEVYWK